MVWSCTTRGPPLRIDLVMALAPEPAAHCLVPICRTAMSPMRPPAPKWKRRVDLLPLINPPPSSRVAGKSDCARHLGGCLLARAPDLWSDESESLYEPASFFLVGVVWCPVPFSSDGQGIPWELMVWQDFFRKEIPNTLRSDAIMTRYSRIFYIMLRENLDYTLNIAR